MKYNHTLVWVAIVVSLTSFSTVYPQSLQWHRQLAGNLPNGSRTYDMTLDANGNVFVVGVFHGTIDFGNGPVSSTQGGNDFYFAMYNANGVLQLFQKIGAANAQVVGQGVSVFNSGGTVFLYVTGHFTSLNGQLLTVNFNPLIPDDPAANLTMNDTDGDAFVAKYNVTNGGTFVWARRIANTRAWGSGGKIATDAAGNAYTVSNESPGPTEKSRIARHSVNGNPDWNVSANGLAYDVAFRGTSVFVCGKSLSIANGRGLARLNPSNGSLQATFGTTSQEFWALALDSNNGIFVVGKNGINAVMKFTTGTSPVWTKSFDANSPFEFDIAVVGPSQNQVVVTGWFTGTVNFNGTTGGSAFVISSTGSDRDIFAARYNSTSGSCLWVKSYPRLLPGGLTYPLSARGNAQSFLISGHVSQNTIDIDFCAGVVNVATNNTDNAFIAQYAILTSPSVAITGDGLVCAQGANQSVNAFGGTITWSVSPANLVVTSSGSGATANLQAASGGGGQATLTFTFNGAVDECGMPVTGSINKTLWVGLTSSLSFTATYNQSQGIMLSTPYVGGGATAQWLVNGVAHAGFDISVQPLCIDYTNIPLEISLTVANQCDSKTVCRDYVLKCPPSPLLTYVGTCGSGGGGEESEFHQESQYSVSPNPANRMVSITVVSGTDSYETSVSSAGETENTATIQSIVLTDMNGQVKYKQEFSSVTREAELDVSGYKKGVYVLKIADREYIEVHRIIVN
jgi:hypothetical protein